MTHPLRASAAGMLLGVADKFPLRRVHRIRLMDTQLHFNQRVRALPPNTVGERRAALLLADGEEVHQRIDVRGGDVRKGRKI
jgi:hypothetical protein